LIPSLFGEGAVTRNLRGALDELSATHKTIADRVANARQSSNNSDFQGALNNSLNKEDTLANDMASLADTEMRYEATAKLLAKSYADLRTAITDHG